MDLPNVPISAGELFDKYSILEIKKEKIVNPEKRKKVVTEINYLNNIINKFKLNPELYNKLTFVRLPNKRVDVCAQVLDAGCSGIIIPNIKNKKEVIK